MNNITILLLLLSVNIMAVGQTVVTLNFPDPCSCDNSVLNELLNIQHVTLPEAVDTCFGATQTIVVGEVGAPFVMQQGASAVMIAGERIVFRRQTTIHQGSHLHAYIAPAGPFCNFHLKHFLQTEDLLVGTGYDQLTPELSSQAVLFRLYPNPTSGMITIELIEPDRQPLPLIEVFDLVGNKLDVIHMKESTPQTVNLSGMPSGIYIISLTSGELKKFERIIKL